MSTDHRKSSGRQSEAGDPPAASDGTVGPGVTRNNSGRVKFDDRGNAVWEWAVKTGSFAVDVSTSRLKKLEATPLSLADEGPAPADVAKAKTRGTSQGYSPYDSGVLAKKDAPPRKKTDLRRLSEFYKLRQQHNRNKQDDE